jgi:hypothetical protein
MSFGRMISLVIAIAAVVGVFVEIPVVSNYAFWVLVGAFLVWELFHQHNFKLRFRYWTMIALTLLLVSIVGVFAYIPIVSDYAFWVLFVAYLMIVGSSGFR